MLVGSNLQAPVKANLKHSTYQKLILKHWFTITLQSLLLYLTIAIPVSSYALTYKEHIEQAPIKQLIVSFAVIYGFDPLIALKIAECESSFNPKAFNINKNGTVDKSIFQINSIHQEEAKLNGFDITTPTGNISMAILLMQKNKYRDWYASKSCWSGKT